VADFRLTIMITAQRSESAAQKAVQSFQISTKLRRFFVSAEFCCYPINELKLLQYALNWLIPACLHIELEVPCGMLSSEWSLRPLKAQSI